MANDVSYFKLIDDETQYSFDDADGEVRIAQNAADIDTLTSNSAYRPGDTVRTGTMFCAGFWSTTSRLVFSVVLPKPIVATSISAVVSGYTYIRDHTGSSISVPIGTDITATATEGIAIRCQIDLTSAASVTSNSMAEIGTDITFTFS